MTDGHLVRACINLKSTVDGGLANPLSSPTRSILLRFSSHVEQSQPAMFGAVMASDMDIAPGARDLPVELRFWADEANMAAQPGATFTLWYGREIGDGEVLEVMT